MVDVLLLRHKRSVETLLSLHMVRVLDQITRDLVKQARASAGAHPKLLYLLCSGETIPRLLPRPTPGHEVRGNILINSHSTYVFDLSR